MAAASNGCGCEDGLLRGDRRRAAGRDVSASRVLCARGIGHLLDDLLGREVGVGAGGDLDVVALAGQRVMSMVRVLYVHVEAWKRL